MARTDLDEVNVHAVDLRDELRQGVQFRLHLSPVVPGAPIANQFLKLAELYALRLIGDRFLVRPAGRGDAPAKIGECLRRNVDLEGAHRVVVSRRGQSVGQQADHARGCRSSKKGSSGG